MRKISLIIIATLTVIYLAANLEPIQRLTLGYGVKYLKNEFDIELTIGKISGNLFHHLTLTDIEIGSVAVIKRIDVSYSPFSIITGRFKIINITITKPMIDVDEALKIKPIARTETRPLAIDIDNLILDYGIIEYQDREIPISLSLSYKGGNIAINDLIINFPKSRIITKGSYHPEGAVSLSYKLNIDLTDLKLGEGKIKSEGTIGGRGKDPNANGGLEYSSVKISKISLNYKYEGQTIYINSLIVAGEGFHLYGNLSYDFTRNLLMTDLKGSIGKEQLTIHCLYQKEEIRATVVSNKWDLRTKGTISKKADIKITGHYQKNLIDGRITYGGKRLEGELVSLSPSVSKGLSIRRITARFDLNFIKENPIGRVEVRFKDIVHSDRRIGDLLLKVNLERNRLFILTSGLMMGKGYLSLNTPNPIRFDFTLNDFNLSSFLKKGNGRVNLTGMLRGVLSGSGGGPDLSVEIDNLTAEINGTKISITDSLKIHYANSKVVVESAIFDIDGSRIVFNGTIGDKLNLHLSTHDFDLQVLNSLLPHQTINGRFDGDIYLSGDISEPKFKGSVGLDQLVVATPKDTIGPAQVALDLNNDSILVNSVKIDYHDISIKDDGPIRFVFTKESIVIQRSGVRINDGLISFKGVIPIGGDSGMAMMVKTDSLDLSNFSKLIPDATVLGFLSITVGLKGQLLSPDIHGLVKIDSVMVVLEKDTIGPINGNIEFVNDLARFKGLTFSYREGQILLDGDLGIRKSGSVTINVEKIRIPIMKKSYANIDAVLTLTGKIDSITIGGEVSVTGSYLEPIDAVMITQTNRGAKEPPEYLKKINLDLGLNLDFKVKNDIADLNLGGDLQISGTAARTGLIGRINIKEGGRIGYLGRNFLIDKGVIDLVDPNKINPVVDIHAQTTLNYQDIDYQITLSITGPPDKLLISLRSEPDLPEQEIIALIITGKTRGIMRIPTAKEVGKKATEYLITKIKEDIEKRTAQALGLDRITVTGIMSEPESVRVEVEKRIRGKVRVTYSTGFENWEQQKVGLDYELNRNLSIYSTYDLENRDAGGGLDLHLKLW